MKNFRYQRPPRAPRTVAGTTDDILSFLNTHGIQDKDIPALRERKPHALKIEKGKGGVPRTTLDLHGLTSEEASRRFRLTMESCRQKGVRELLVIHGQGHHSRADDGPVLKTLVRQMLENELVLSVERFRTGLPREGGDGATVVYLAGGGAGFQK